MRQARRCISGVCALSWGKIKAESMALAPSSTLHPEWTLEFPGEPESSSTAADCSACQYRSTGLSDLLFGCLPDVPEAGANTLSCQRTENTLHRMDQSVEFTNLVILCVIQRLTWVTFLQMCFSIYGKLHLTFVKSCLKIQHKIHKTFPVALFDAFVEVRNQKNVSLGRSLKKILQRCSKTGHKWRELQAKLSKELLLLCKVNNDWIVNCFLISFAFSWDMVKGLI